MLTRRVLLGAVAALGAPMRAAFAEIYPSRTVRIIVPTPAGGPVDTMARVVANALPPLLGQPVVVENRAGAGNTLGSKAAATADPDGYTLIYTAASGLVMSPMLRSNAGYTAADFAPIAIVSEQPMVMVANPSAPFKTVAELVAYAKANPGKLNYSTGGAGTLPHLTAELFRQRAGLVAQAVSFRTTGEVVTALLRKDVAYAVDLAHAVRGQVASGELKLIAVATGRRFPSLAQVPTMIESGMPGFEVNGWYGFVYPAGVSGDVIARSHKALTEVLARDAVKKQLENIGAEAALSSPEEFGKLIADEVTRWRAVAKSAGLEPQ